MAPPAATAGTGAGAQPPQQQQGGISQMMTGIIRVAVFWYFASKFFGPKKPADPSVLMSNLFQKGEPLVSKSSLFSSSSICLYIYLAASLRFRCDPLLLSTLFNTFFNLIQSECILRIDMTIVRYSKSKSPTGFVLLFV